ncbi:MAG: acyltransferase family protein [Actinomycetota bacterium]|nr:acyltransferase family protein [Actinomycetota bacterium]
MAARDPWFDNAKMALVTLVVIGHGWTLLPQSSLDRHLYDFLYSWHIPAFVLVTGYLSRGFGWTRPRMWQLVRTVAVPYVLFECAFGLFRVYVGGETLDGLFLDPHWPLWYLPALFLWRLLTPIFRALPGGLFLAVVISLAAGVWVADTLDLARVLGLLPFFVLGLKATPERLETLRSRSAVVAAVVVMVGVVVVTWFVDAWASTEWLYYRAMYVELTTSDLQAVATRAAVLAIGGLGALAFLALVPRVSGWFTRMGAATLVVYLFHGFAVKGAEFAGFQGWADEHAAYALVLTTLGGLALSLLLACPAVSSRLADVVDPFGYAERHTTHAAHLAVAVDESAKLPPDRTSPR